MSTEAVKSSNLDLVSQFKYLADEKMSAGDEEKVVRYKQKLTDWKRDVKEKRCQV